MFLDNKYRILFSMFLDRGKKIPKMNRITWKMREAISRQAAHWAAGRRRARTFPSSRGSCEEAAGVPALLDSSWRAEWLTSNLLWP